MYRVMEYQKGRHKIELSGTIERIEYDPNRTAYIAACISPRRRYYKIVGGNEMPKVGSELKVKELRAAAIGDSVYSVSTKEGKCGTIARAAGAACKIVKQEQTTTVIRLPSSQVIRLNNTNICTAGRVYGRPITRLGTAGANRRLGVRPSVRGVAMNPSDHPNGGKTHSSKIKNK